MASNYTRNYNLCQWEATDQVLRTDFNEDNQKVDAALLNLKQESAAQSQVAQNLAQRGIDALVPLAHNVYHSVLQSYRAGQNCQWVSGMAFDGFRDSSRIKTMSDNVRIDTENQCLILSGDAVSEFDGNYGTRFTTTLKDGASAQVVWRATGSATVTGVTFALTEGGGSLTVTGPEGELLGNSTLSGSTASMSFRVSLGSLYTFTFTAAGQTTLGRDLGTDPFGFKLAVTNPTVIPGRISSTSFSVGYRYPHVRAWVRYGPLYGSYAPVVHIDVGGMMQEVNSRWTVDPLGQQCWETEYVLDWSPFANTNFSVILELAVNYPSTLKIFDYGAVIL